MSEGQAMENLRRNLGWRTIPIQPEKQKSPAWSNALEYAIRNTSLAISTAPVKGLSTWSFSCRPDADRLSGTLLSGRTESHDIPQWDTRSTLHRTRT